MSKRLILVLGDQLTLGRGALRDADPANDTIVMAEVAEEAQYVLHNRHKIALIFAAMRHFRTELEAAGYHVIYYEYRAGIKTLEEAAARALRSSDAEVVLCCEPGEYRLHKALQAWRLPVPITALEDDRFLVSQDTFRRWASGRKSLRMEYFYREVRRNCGFLMTAEGKPEGGRWNYDAENRAGWRAKHDIPERPEVVHDAITRQVISEVSRDFPHNPGNLESFSLATTHQQAMQQFLWFLDNCLGNFGRYQDAMADESPWLFHSLISMYLNIGLLDPLSVCEQAESRYREGGCDLAAVEGFIRQIAGWREYVRGIYWLHMPGYDQLDALQANVPLPQWFWTGDTDMRCLSVALRQSLDLGYAHHIQRLMVIGNFALLAGLDVREVCQWYLAVYVDAFEWVELPNTLGMALHADDGIMASKPYCASGKYIQRQGNHCQNCTYSPTKVTGDKACPFNSLYWHFINRHEATWASNPRMTLAVRNWQRKSREERAVIIQWADGLLAKL